MARTTLNLDPSVLGELRRRSVRERKSMGDLASELLLVALDESVAAPSTAPLHWISRELGRPTVDLEDKEAVRRALDGSP